MSHHSAGNVQAVGFHTFGGPDRVTLIDIPMPQPEENHILVQVHAATVNPTDVMMLEGKHAAKMAGLSPPYIAGMEFSGKVVVLGKGVSDIEVGQSVVGIVNPRRVQGGAHAEYVSVPAASVTLIPEDADFIAAATIPMNGMTAQLSLDALQLNAGNTLLITGAIGAVGGYALQLAKQQGLYVIVDAKGSDRNALHALGADEIINRGPDFQHAVQKKHPSGVDGVIDAATLGEAAIALVKNGGSVAVLRGAIAVSRGTVRTIPISAIQHSTNTPLLQRVVKRYIEGALTPRIAARFTKDHASAAYEAVIAGGLRGRVVLDFSPSA